MVLGLGFAAIVLLVRRTFHVLKNVLFPLGSVYSTKASGAE